jgi:hypothetical protein
MLSEVQTMFTEMPWVSLWMTAALLGVVELLHIQQIGGE